MIETDFLDDEKDISMTTEKSLKKSAAESTYLTVVLLAAGKGTRMKSPLPKVLHPVAGRPMIEKAIAAAKNAGAKEVRVVVGHGHALVKSVVEPLGCLTFLQTEQLGTAHAVRCAQLDGLDGEVVIMNGDHPLIEAADIASFVKDFRETKSDLSVVTAKVKKPGEFGRIVRHLGELKAIVEAKDASADTLKLDEINTGIYIARAAVLSHLLPLIQNHNAKKEFYITDMISLGLEEGYKVTALRSTPKVAVGVNTQEELAKATRLVFLRKAKQLMENGVLMLNPRETYIEESVEVAAGSVIYPNVFLRGQTKIGAFSVIESNSFISDSVVGNSVQIKAGSYIEHSQILDKASVGPYARLRPQTVIGEEAHIGNFVELKKVNFGKKSKAGHLTYLGDAEIGEEVNIGCGTITCNYAVDKQKYKTKIGNRVFVGSDTQFVAPIEVGDDAIIGSGSTITKPVPAKALAVARGRQTNIENYAVKKDSTEKSE
ncbi:MAG: bifunctional UDP-N-acetylglucosamine diphosphorylase/glucosamine-1-phosphate N-acetyltransferase GlmU [Bdellovibrionia bacterium]